MPDPVRVTRLLGLLLWWHRRCCGGQITVTRVTPPLFDVGARGILAQCECGKVWAR